MRDTISLQFMTTATMSQEQEFNKAQTFWLPRSSSYESFSVLD